MREYTLFTTEVSTMFSTRVIGPYMWDLYFARICLREDRKRVVQIPLALGLKWMKLKRFQKNVNCVEARVIIAKIALILILHVSSTCHCNIYHFI